MRRVCQLIAAVAAVMVAATPALCAEGRLLDSMDTITLTPTSDKVHVEAVEGKFGKAALLRFDNGCQGAYINSAVRGAPDWDQAAGISFWVKGDGSNHLGGIELIWNEDYAQRFAFAFPIDSTEWRKVVVPWRDMIPEVSAITGSIDAKGDHVPSKLRLMFGKWWYWRDYEAHSYAIDDVRLEPVIPPAKVYRQTGAPLGRVLAKLRKGQPVTVVTMGDSLTDTVHWSNRESNWPAMLKSALEKAYKSQVTIVNPAMGGTELRQNLIVMPRWVKTAPKPDLVTVFFGGNDWASGMRGPDFTEAQKDAVDRVRAATGGTADLLILTTCPAAKNGDTYTELAVACRAAAKARSAGLADVYAAFTASPEREKLFAWDGVHLSPAGQELVARLVAEAIARGK